MKFLVYSEINADNISHSLGLPDYSYYFVLRDFKSVLEMLGEVIVIGDPALEVDHHYDMATANREACVFLSFTPPHNTCLGLRCPTIPVFAWEFDSIPNEHWLNDPRQDWCHVLKTCGSAITHSELTVRAVKEKLGADFPIISIPSPSGISFPNFAANSSKKNHRQRRSAISRSSQGLFSTLMTLRLPPTCRVWMP